MKNILLIGAGRSASNLIQYFLKNGIENNWFLTVCDLNLELAQSKIKGFANAKAVEFDINNVTQRQLLIQSSDIVVSMLPAFMHLNVAKDCLTFKKNMVTASYVSDEMKEMNELVEKAGLLFMNEIGLDPGIDHLSAIKIINDLKEKGAEISDFESYTGGLVAPESDNNPWHYKFSWNPRNVVLAGQGPAAKFLHNNNLKFIPYHKLFERFESLEIPEYGIFEGYANRDSLKYKSAYGLENAATFVRGTLRKDGYCGSWNILVQLGLTDDSYQIENLHQLTWNEFLNSFIPEKIKGNTRERLAQYLSISQTNYINNIEWLGLFSNEKIPLQKASPAFALQCLLEQKWKLEPNDKDMIVMWHQFKYRLNNENHKLQSYLVVKGDDETYTAMSKTVGLPLAICTKLILEGKINLKGVQMPLQKEVYEPILNELEQFGIAFEELEMIYS